MKKVLFLALCMFMFSLVSPVLAAEPMTASTPEDKPVVALLFVNNAKTTFDDELTDKVLSNVKKTLGTAYVVKEGTPYVEKLNKQGIADISTAERSDIVDTLKGEDIDYALYVEIQPFVRKEKVSFFSYGLDMTAVVPIKIISIAENKYNYNGKIVELASEGTMIGGLGNKSVCLKALDIVNQKMTGIIETRLPKTRPGSAQPVQP